MPKKCSETELVNSNSGLPSWFFSQPILNIFSQSLIILEPIAMFVGATTYRCVTLDVGNFSEMEKFPRMRTWNSPWVWGSMSHTLSLLSSQQ